MRRVLPDGTIETIEDKILPSGFVHYTHGYVVTSHKSQGSTADHVVVVVAARLNAKSACVACSRGRQSCTVFTPDKEYLLANLPRSADREAALDVLRARAAKCQQTAHQDAVALRHAAINSRPKAETAVEENISHTNGFEASILDASKPEESGDPPITGSPTGKIRACR